MQTANYDTRLFLRDVGGVTEEELALFMAVWKGCLSFTVTKNYFSHGRFMQGAALSKILRWESLSPGPHVN